MSRRLRRALTAAGLVLVVAAGCGVPGDSDPKRVGTPQRAVQADERADEPPQDPDGVNAPEVLLNRYLQASAWGNTTGGDRPNGIAEAVDRVKRFLTPSALGTWQPTADFKLFNVKIQSPVQSETAPFTIPATVRQVGTLTAEGAVDPVVAEPSTVVFRVVDIGDGKLRIDNPLAGMVFNVAQLANWYRARTIYFWDAGGRTLVPDIRYMPTGVDPAKRPNEIAGWLQGGPSRWLGSAVRKVPDGIEVQGNIVPEQRNGDASLPVNLTAKAAGVGDGQGERRTRLLTDFLIQMRWSLREAPDVPGPRIELQIEGTTQNLQYSEESFRAANAAVWPANLNEPEAYGVVGGTLRAFAATQTVPLLDPEHNRDVLSASITRLKSAVAYVTREGGGRQRLWLAVAGTGADAATVFRPTEVSGQALSRPVWLDGSGQRLLVAVDGGLYLVNVADGGFVAVPVPGINGPITAVSPAPDGRRLAFVAAGRAYVAAVRVDETAMSVQQPRELTMVDLAERTAIDWAAQDRVVIGGRSTSGPPLVEAAVDGTDAVPVNKEGLDQRLRVTRIAAYPDSPIVVDRDRPDSTTRRLMLLEAGDAGSFNVFSGEIRQIQPPAPTAAPSPTPTSTSAPPPQLASAPFFLD